MGVIAEPDRERARNARTGRPCCQVDVGIMGRRGRGPHGDNLGVNGVDGIGNFIEIVETQATAAGTAAARVVPVIAALAEKLIPYDNRNVNGIFPSLLSFNCYAARRACPRRKVQFFIFLSLPVNTLNLPYP